MAANEKIPQQPLPHELRHLGLVLIKVGTVLAFIFPVISVITVMSLPMSDPFAGSPSLVPYIFAAFVVLGFAFGLVSALFYRNIVRGNTSRITHELVLGIVTVVAGSNIAGILIAIGAYLCHSSTQKANTRATTT